MIIAAMTDPGTAGRPFVGRRHELADLCAGLDDAVHGTGRLFLVVGEAGIGKTRLVEELAREASTRTAIVLWGRCWEAAGAPPYWPWAQVIRACVRRIGGDRSALGPEAPRLAQLVPGLADAPPSLSLESEDARFYLFDAVGTFLRRVAERAPIVVMIDDLQWADAPS